MADLRRSAKMKRLLVLLGMFATAVLRCSAERCEDLGLLCDATEAYFRAEERVIARNEPAWAPYAKTLLVIRLADIDFQREQITLLKRDEKKEVRVSRMGWCGLRIGEGGAFKPADTLLAVLKDWEQREPDAGVRYVTLTTKWQSEIGREWHFDEDRFRTILRRFIPEEEPNQ